VKGAVVIQVYPIDAANDTQNWKVVADNQNVFRVGVSLNDLIESVPGALGDIGKPLPTGDTDLSGLGAPAL
jgi:hypothetical protein